MPKIKLKDYKQLWMRLNPPAPITRKDREMTAYLKAGGKGGFFKWLKS